jgi:hypothetical protein
MKEIPMTHPKLTPARWWTSLNKYKMTWLEGISKRRFKGMNCWHCTSLGDDLKLWLQSGERNELAAKWPSRKGGTYFSKANAADLYRTTCHEDDIEAFQNQRKRIILFGGIGAVGTVKLGAISSLSLEPVPEKGAWKSYPCCQTWKVVAIEDGFVSEPSKRLTIGRFLGHKWTGFAYHRGNLPKRKNTQ